MNNKEKFNWILAILLGVVISILVHKFVMNNVELTTQDYMDIIKEVPEVQDKGIVLEEELIMVENR